MCCACVSHDDDDVGTSISLSHTERKTHTQHTYVLEVGHEGVDRVSEGSLSHTERAGDAKVEQGNLLVGPGARSHEAQGEQGVHQALHPEEEERGGEALALRTAVLVDLLLCV